MKDSLKWLLNKFPYFLNKNPDSNFYKSTSVINESFKEFRQDLFATHLGHRLEKMILIWKEQEVDYDYTMNFHVHLPYLKRVNVYKNNVLIYSESYEYDDEVDTFIYSYDDTSNKVIPSDKYRIAAETFEEYTLRKGFPENDTVKDDYYDHDYSLDELGALYDVPRKSYVYTKNTNPGNTEPPYNNRATEDDYHYMNRLLFYVNHLHDTPLPVLEVWKLFGIPLDHISLVNRERYLCKMYSVTKHGGDNWTPQPWEHKDTMSCSWSEPVFFFVQVDNHTPVYGQSINFNFTFMNMYGEDKGKGYLIDVYLDDDLIAEDITPLSDYSFSTVDVDDMYPLTFRFVAKPLDTRYSILESDEIIINIKGCNSADWYVATDGNDSNPGTNNAPFATIGKALSMVRGSRNVVVLKEGTYTISNMETIDDNTSIISCQGATIVNTVSPDFFEVVQSHSLYLQGVDLVYGNLEMESGDGVTFVNGNVVDTPVYVRVRYGGGAGLHVWSDDLTKYQGGAERFVVTVMEDGAPVEDEAVVFTFNGNTYNRTTNSNGEASIALNINPDVCPISFTVRGVTYTNTVTVLPRFVGEDITKYERGSEAYICTILDDTGSPVPADTTVSVSINGAITSYSTDNHGRITVPLTEAPGEYNITVLYDGLNYTNNVTVLSRLIAEDLTKYERCTEQFTVEVLDSNGEHVPDGTSVTFNISGKNYTRETSNGFAIANINLGPGTYSITTSYSDVTSITNEINVLPRLTASDLTMDYGDGSTFNAVLTDCDGIIVSGETVTFNIEGDIYSAITDSGGVARLPITLPVGRYIVTTDYGLLDEISNNIIINAGGYSLSISASPTTIEYGETVTVSGTLLHDDVGVSGKTITIYDGSTSLGTVTTESDGSYSKTITDLSLSGSYTVHNLKAVHDNAESNTVNVTVTKITTTTSLSATSSTIYVGNAPSLTGTLLANGSGLTGASVDIYLGGSKIDTVTTTTGGAFSYTGSATTTTGTLTFKAVYDGDSTHNTSESSNVTVTVTEESHDYALSLSGTAIIQTGTVDTITATVTDNGSPVNGAVMSYQIKHGTTTIDSGTVTTNSSGVATISYIGTGVGDVSVIVSNTDMLLQEIYEVQDYILYDPTGFSKTTTTSTDTNYPSDYDFAMPQTTNFQLEFDYNNPSSFRLYFASTKVTSVGDSIQYGIGFTRDGSGKLTFTERTTTTSNTTCQSISSGTNHYKVVFNGNTVNVWVNDVQQVSNKTLSWWSSHFPYYWNWGIWAVGTGTVNNIKIKAL